jgi:hypothetical protein
MFKILGILSLKDRLLEARIVTGGKLVCLLFYHYFKMAKIKRTLHVKLNTNHIKIKTVE